MTTYRPLCNFKSPVHLILKTVGDRCNLRCEYCFERKKQKKTLANDSVTPEQLLSFLIWANRPISISLHGGEPLLLGKKKTQALLSAIRSYQETTQFVEGVFVQTNGTLLDDEWLDLFFEQFKDLDIELAISLDGHRDMNSLRVYPDGLEAYDQIQQKFELIAARGKTAGLLSVLSKQNLLQAKEYMKFLASLPAVRFVKINPLYNITGNQLDAISITPAEYTQFLQEAFEHYIKLKLFNSFPVEPFLGYIQRCSDVFGFYCNFNNRKCLQFVSLYPDGRLGLCDNYDPAIYPLEFSEDESFEDCMEKTFNSKHVQRLKNKYSECIGCDVLDICTGGCFSQRLLLSKVKGLEKEYCTHRRDMALFFKSRLSSGVLG